MPRHHSGGFSFQCQVKNGQEISTPEKPHRKSCAMFTLIVALEKHVYYPLRKAGSKRSVLGYFFLFANNKSSVSKGQANFKEEINLIFMANFRQF